MSDIPMFPEEMSDQEAEALVGLRNAPQWKSFLGYRNRRRETILNALLSCDPKYTEYYKGALFVLMEEQTMTDEAEEFLHTQAEQEVS
jgi:hypothetical protein